LISFFFIFTRLSRASVRLAHCHPADFPDDRREQLPVKITQYGFYRGQIGHQQNEQQDYIKNYGDDIQKFRHFF